MTLKRLTTICIAGILFLCLHHGISIAGVAISPALVELQLDGKPAAGEFVIRNTGNSEERYRIMASHFKFDWKGGIEKVEPDENSLVPWIKFNPKEFTLPPKSRRNIRFAVAPRGRAASNKEYWCYMELMSLNENVASATDSGRTMKIKVVPSILVPIFAIKGEVTHNANIEEIKVQPDDATTHIYALISNTGTGHVLLGGTYELKDSAGNIVKDGKIGRNYLLPGNQREIHVTINEELPPGEYGVVVVCSAPQLKESLTNEIHFTR